VATRVQAGSDATSRSSRRTQHPDVLIHRFTPTSSRTS
jgi:hypothetical protein